MGPRKPRALTRRGANQCSPPMRVPTGRQGRPALDETVAGSNSTSPARGRGAISRSSNAIAATGFCIAAMLVFLLAGPAAAEGTVQSRFFVTSDGVRLHYLESGPRLGHTIVFVPGWTMPAWIWQPQIRAFEPYYHVVAFDPRGQGDSDAPATGYEPGRRSQDIAELIANLGSAPVVLVAWSLGVLDTLAYVRAHGDLKVAGLVLVDNSVGEEPPPPPRAPRRPGPALPHAAAMHRFVAGMFYHRPSDAYLDRLTEATLAHARAGEPGAARLSGAAHLLARGGVFHHQTGALRGAAGLAVGAGGEPCAQPAGHADRRVRRRRPRAVRRRCGAIQRAAGRLRRRGPSGRDTAHRAGAAVPRVVGCGGIRDRADPLLRRREVVGIRLLGDLHRDGRICPERRDPGAVSRCLRASRRGAAGRRCRRCWSLPPRSASTSPRPIRSIRCNCRTRRPGASSSGTSPATTPACCPSSSSPASSSA